MFNSEKVCAICYARIQVEHPSLHVEHLSLSSGLNLIVFCLVHYPADLTTKSQSSPSPRRRLLSLAVFSSPSPASLINLTIFT